MANHPEIVADYIQKEVSLGRVTSPFWGAISHVSPFGVIPKSSAGQWRLIVDLSHSEVGSVNDGIRPEWCSLSYVSVDNLVEEICNLGRGTLIAKCVRTG